MEVPVSPSGSVPGTATVTQLCWLYANQNALFYRNWPLFRTFTGGSIYNRHRFGKKVAGLENYHFFFRRGVRVPTLQTHDSVLWTQRYRRRRNTSLRRTPPRNTVGCGVYCPVRRGWWSCRSRWCGRRVANLPWTHHLDQPDVPIPCPGHRRRAELESEYCMK